MHFTVTQNHTRYCDVRVQVVGPEFFQPATSSVLTSFSCRHPLAYSLAGLNWFQRVSRLAPYTLVIRNRRKGCRLPAWPSLQSEVLSADTTFLKRFSRASFLQLVLLPALTGFDELAVWCLFTIAVKEKFAGCRGSQMTKRKAYAAKSCPEIVYHSRLFIDSMDSTYTVFSQA